MYTAITLVFFSGQTVCSVKQCAFTYTAITSVFVLDRPCVQFSIVLWCAQPSHLYLFWTGGVFSSALCSDAHSHHIKIYSGQTVCWIQHCALMRTAVTSVFVLERRCVQFSIVLWCAQPSHLYLFWTDGVFSSALCSGAHSHYINICSGQIVWSLQHCALTYTAIISVFFLDNHVFSSALCPNLHSHHINICSGQTAYSVQHCALMYTVITWMFVL